MNQEDARLTYELALGRRVTDRSWYSTKRLLAKHQLELTPENLQFFAQIRTLIPRSAIGVSGILECYEKAEKIMQSHASLKGSEIVSILSGYGVKPHQTTISRWFSSIGGYRRDRSYPASALKVILTQAFIYKASFSPALPQGVNHG
ncbi:hypothetical protein [Allocoleopsis franciscana]|uniref:Uncharacterized protein n=1 Tax=Allocoleopsis franciscana PCC 7113 TaxID=1173027 RepID=K9WS53_9CYAN|nr:hypothetical protein [Allocoleopsis franciscana]AFZ22387.1 hypothetical protein Mic7113_6830 [Allocoleopsis franciscana PCC 7113]